MNESNFLYSEFDTLSKYGQLGESLPERTAAGLNPNFKLRKYQHEAFKRLIYYLNRHKDTKSPTPKHLLFNMATGSGKTLIMAGLILHLYTQGYRNFLFFVNATNIIDKTRDNFLDSLSSKYLFAPNINLGERFVDVREVDNFEEADSDNINICFTTTQKLHLDMQTASENSLTLDDFKDKKIVLLSDESHHMQATTRQGILIPETEGETWEVTVESIFNQNAENVLLEFTATMDYMNENIVDKYYSKVIYRYTLKEFRNDGYSKDVDILQSDLDNEGRMLQAIIISQYRQRIAGEEQINLKPVILFKAQRTVADSEKNEKDFAKLISELDVAAIEELRKESRIELLQRALKFFSDKGGLDALAQSLKQDFAPKYCLNVNREDHLNSHQRTLNTLEDSDNPIRAIFAVQKLNEGWDVLNLFDIVRLYNTRDARKNKPGKTTIAEAQLIGRGARYFPFSYKDEQRDMRKFDKMLDHRLRILEVLHYHSFNNVEYISELKTALAEQGIYDERAVTVRLLLKEEFKNKNFYKTALVYLNEKVKNKNEKINSVGDLLGELQDKHPTIEYNIPTGFGDEVSVFGQNRLEHGETSAVLHKDVKVKDIEKHIIRKAMARIPFYYFDNLKINFFPNIKSETDFIDNYLGGFTIRFKGKKEDLENLSNLSKLLGVEKLLHKVEDEARKNTSDYMGTHQFKPHNFRERFFDKDIKLDPESERYKGQRAFVADKPWYVFEENYGTSEEKSLVEAITPQMEEFSQKYKDVYLVRNERHVKIYNFKDGRGFEPDFLLFLRKEKGPFIVYQLFIEPKGELYMQQDAWKEKFLEEIKENHEVEYFGGDKVRIIGLPFYNSRGVRQVAFLTALQDAVEGKENTESSEQSKKT